MKVRVRVRVRVRVWTVVTETSLALGCRPCLWQVFGGSHIRLCARLTLAVPNSERQRHTVHGASLARRSSYIRTGGHLVPVKLPWSRLLSCAIVSGAIFRQAHGATEAACLLLGALVSTPIVQS